MSATAELDHKQHPTLFIDKLNDAFSVAGMGTVQLEPNIPTAAGATNVMKPSPDWSTRLLLSILHYLTPSTFRGTLLLDGTHTP